MKKLFLNLLILNIVLIGFSSNPCWALGKIGHRVTGQIAYNHMTPKARSKVAELLAHESLAEASNWPDVMRSNPDLFWQKTATSWHYVSIEDGQTYATSKKNPKGDIVQAISTLKAILAGQQIPEGVVKQGLESYFGKLNKSQQHKKIKVFALKFLMHLVGDIHQPMHVGYASDRGGNTIKLHWFNKDSNLHRVWDSNLIDSLQLSYSELSEFIDIDDKSVIKQIQNASIEDWISEAMQLRTEAYKIGKGNLRYDYIYKNVPVIKQQLLKAGLRMAALLNEIYK